jgi:hypothetical protein
VQKSKGKPKQGLPPTQVYPRAKQCCLGIALFWMPYSPRWLVEQGRDDEAKSTLSYLRSSPAETPEVVTEYLEIKAEVMIQRELKAISTAGKGGLRAAIQPYLDLFSSWSNFHRLYIGCTTMFFQQFIGCNVSPSRTRPSQVRGCAQLATPSSDVLLFLSLTFR